MLALPLRKGNLRCYNRDMEFESCELSGVVVCRPVVHRDARGFFREISRVDEYSAAGVDMGIVQVNTSCSVPGVLRGMHYQLHHPQSKLVSCVAGAVFDVIVDCRPDSPTFGRWFGIELSAGNGVELFVPRGFAHGIQVLGDVPATIIYQVNDYYHPGDEGGFNWASPEVGIDWPCMRPAIMTDRDATLPMFSRELAFPVV